MKAIEVTIYPAFGRRIIHARRNEDGSVTGYIEMPDYYYLSPECAKEPFEYGDGVLSKQEMKMVREHVAL